MCVSKVKKVAFFDAFVSTKGFRSSMSEFIFHMGYQGWEPSRFLRKLFSRSKLHCAWLSGFTGLGILSIDELRSDHCDEIFF